MTTTLIPPGTIVVGLDGSSSAERALDWAIHYAVLERRQLTLAHSRSHDDTDGLLATARMKVAERAPELAVHEATWTVDPHTMLLELGESAYAVVVGSRGRGPVRSALLGSVGVAVVRDATCPVVVVRPHHPGVVRHGVLVGADGSPSSRATVEHAYHQASLRRLPLTILHGVQELWPPDATSDDLTLPVAEPLAGLAEKYPDVRTRFELVRDDAAAVLVEQSRRMDLVVVGAHRGSRLSTMVEGSVAMSVVEHAACPVVVVP